MTRLQALIRKESLEQRWIVGYICIVLIILIFFTLYILFGGNDRSIKLTTFDGVNFKNINEYHARITTIFILASYYTQIAYFLGSCFNERIDKSIVFWRSMPVSDSMSILAKISTGLVVIPAYWALATFSAVIMTSIIFSFWHMDTILYITMAWNQLLTYLLKSLHCSFFVSPIFLSLMLFSSLANRSPALMAAKVSITAFLIDRGISSLFGTTTTAYQLIGQFYSSIFSEHSVDGLAGYILPVTSLIVFNTLAFIALVSIRKRFT